MDAEQGRHRPGGEWQPVRFGPFVFDPTRRRLMRGDELVPLTSGEMNLLGALALHAARPLSRDRLVSLLQGREGDATDRSVDVQVLRLRRVIEPEPGRPRYLQAVRGVGYVLIVDENVP
jgi:two-component system phosphate regulon response regulator OmpR